MKNDNEYFSMCLLVYVVECQVVCSIFRLFCYYTFESSSHILDTRPLSDISIVNIFLPIVLMVFKKIFYLEIIYNREKYQEKYTETPTCFI